MEFVLVVATALVLDGILLVLIYDLKSQFFAISVITRAVGMERKPTEPLEMRLGVTVCPAYESHVFANKNCSV